jgi:membrane-associated protease RseP (regulator of RpoE activity)
MDEQPPDPRFEPPSLVPGRRRRRFRIPEHPLFHLALLAATFVTTTTAGGAFTDKGGWLGKGHFADGFAFSIPLLIILGSHELGHYFMCRRYGLAATLPYFIPSPLINLVGTFGALIRIKEPIRDKRQLLDVGAAGPLTGFFVTIPFLIHSVPLAGHIPVTTSPGNVLFDYPLAVRLVQRWTGVAYTSATVHEHPMFMAAWFGLLVTALNLMPIGQLDGGHVLRAAVGRRQPRVSLVILVLAVVSAFWSPTWAVFAGMVALLFGVRHPPVEDDDEPLDFGRQLIALLCVAVFLLSFTLVPVRIL